MSWGGKGAALLLQLRNSLLLLLRRFPSIGDSINSCHEERLDFSLDEGAEGGRESSLRSTLLMLLLLLLLEEEEGKWSC